MFFLSHPVQHLFLSQCWADSDFALSLLCFQGRNWHLCTNFYQPCCDNLTLKIKTSSPKSRLQAPKPCQFRSVRCGVQEHTCHIPHPQDSVLYSLPPWSDCQCWVLLKYKEVRLIRQIKCNAMCWQSCGFRSEMSINCKPSVISPWGLVFCPSETMIV